MQDRKITHDLWLDNIKVWSGVTLQHMLRTAEDRIQWRVTLGLRTAQESSQDETRLSARTGLVYPTATKYE